MIRVPDELEKKPVEVWSEPLNPPEEMGPPQPLEETNLNPSPPSIQGKTSLPSQKTNKQTQAIPLTLEGTHTPNASSLFHCKF